ncbi:MAG TPA: Holliday junction branch migration protein RuvA [Bryobacteraceae bacterium]|nr:Holliday junction branch migration protein RuvA [Bryobacteraceae bacterium]
MIALLRGILVEKHPNQAIVDAGGVGYDVTIPVSTFSSLPDVGAKVELRIHTHVREDTIALFGFISAQEKALFEKLINVSGIGPKLAVTALSGLAAESLISAIRGGAVDQLVRIPGVGKKTAERMVLELRDKMDAVSVHASTPGVAPASLDPLESDVISALVNLGLQRPAAEAALKKAKSAVTEAGFEALFRKSLEYSR